MMNIGKSIKVALAIRGLNQSELARQYGWNLRSLNKLANSQQGTVNNINKLSEALGMKPSEFVALGED